MKKALSILLAAMMLLGSLPTAFASSVSGEDYTVAEKLTRQLWAGSGFSGTLQVSTAANTAAGAAQPALQKPLDFQWEYIYVRPNGETQEEHRLDISLVNGETVETAAHLQWQDNSLAMQADWLGTDWLRLTSADDAAAAAEPADVDPAATADAAADPVATGEPAPADEAAPARDDAATPDAALDNSLNSLLSRTGISGLLSTALPLLSAKGSSNNDLEMLLDRYLTRMDLWLEGYRRSAGLEKQDDGTMLMEVDYAVSAANIKAQIKQMVSSLVEDPAAISLLENYFGAETAAPLLQYSLQTYYFAAIDALPLEGDMIIARTVNMDGETVELHLSLPFYDNTAGNVNLSYDRTAGQGDTPTQNSLTIEGDRQMLQLICAEQAGEEDASVISGTLLSQQLNTAEEKPLAIAFTLTKKETEGQDSQNRDMLNWSYQLSLTPDPAHAEDAPVAFDDLDISLEASFASQVSKTASTEVNATLEIGGASRPQTWTLAFYGRTRKQWMPDPLPAQVQDINALSQQDLSALLAAGAVNAGVTLLPYVNPQAPTDTDAAVDTTGTATVAPTDTPAPTAIAPADTDAPRSD